MKFLAIFAKNAHFAKIGVTKIGLFLCPYILPIFGELVGGQSWRARGAPKFAANVVSR